MYQDHHGRLRKQLAYRNNGSSMTPSLEGLAVPRQPDNATASRGPRTTQVLAGVIFVSLALAGSLLWGRLTPPLAVTVLAVAATNEIRTDGGIVTRASGWFQPEPQPVTVSAQRAGTIVDILVRQGETVKAGALIATLDDRDAALTLRRAEVSVATASAAVSRSDAELEAASARLAQARDRFDRLRQARGTTSDNEQSQAGHDVAVRAAELEVARTTRAVVAGTHAMASVELDAATLDHERCRITAPIEGMILRVAALSGQRLGLDDASTSLIAVLFDPRKLGVRADVTISEAAAVRVGMRAEITCDMAGTRVLSGKVVAVAGHADPTRNTLQFHIAMDHVPPELRPDMPARIRIIGDDNPSSTEALRLLAPSLGLQDQRGDQAVAWVVDQKGQLRRRQVAIAGPERDGWTPVSGGLQLGEPVVTIQVDGLREGRPATTTYAMGP